MASLIQVRDLLALRGRMEAAQISQALNTPQPMINAMLQQLESMGKAVRIQEEPDGCLSGSCKSCPEGKACLREWWRCVNLTPSPVLKSPVCVCIRAFCVRLSIKMQPLQRDVNSSESVSQG